MKFFNKISILFRYLLPTFMFNISYYLILTTKKCTTKNVSMFHEIYDLYLLSEKLNINFTFLKEFPPILIITSLGRSLATSFWYIIHNHENQSFITKFLCQVHTTLVSAKAWFSTNWRNPVFFTSFIMLMKIQSQWLCQKLSCKSLGRKNARDAMILWLLDIEVI